MTSYTPIDCGDYDILEVVCLYHYEVELRTDKTTLRGTASGLEIKSGAEYLLIDSKDGNSREVRIDQIHALTVLSKPARFDHHVFTRTGHA